MSQRKTYTKEFKVQSVQAALSGKKPVTQVAEELGLAQSILWRWIKEFRKEGQTAFPGQGNLSPEEEERRRLKT